MALEGYVSMAVYYYDDDYYHYYYYYYDYCYCCS